MLPIEADRATSREQRKSLGRIWPDWYQTLTPFRTSIGWQAAWQLLNTLVPYGGLWYLMVRSRQLGCSYLLTLLLALLAAAFLVRIFILFHDCVHDSFFAAKGANTLFGYFLGVLVFTPFEDWRYGHLRHHATYANLDTRGFGDIWTLTLKEYQSAPRAKRWLYRCYRNPVVLPGLGAVFIFLLRNRLPTRAVRRKERSSVLFTNLLILLMILVADRLMGWRTYLLIQLPVMWFAGAAGIWLFYVQHQFPGGYWARTHGWDPVRAAMEGSSFYNLPAVLRWFSGNIGYHHVHHLSSRIPNYRLQKCYEAIPELRAKVPLTLAQSLACLRLKVWDEERWGMVPFP